MLKITVITPNYNYSKYISKTIESVVNQNYDCLEHIIVDDGSTDNSVEIIESYVKRYPRIIKLIRKKNSGQTKALNDALSAATGDIITWINSDDYYCNDVFPLIAEHFKNDKTLDAIFGNIKIVDDCGNLIKSNKYLNFDYASGVFNGFGKIISSNAIFWKKYLSDEVGFFDENFHYAMDSEYWSRLLYRRKVKHIPLYVAYFRWHPGAKTISRRELKSIAYNAARIEDKLIFERSYNKTFISKFIPLKYSSFLKLFYKGKRVFLRFINGHYFI